MTARIQIALDLWSTWADIAMDHEVTARVVRNQLVRAKREGEVTFHFAVSQEFTASIVAVSAAAHALDALYGQLRVQLPRQGGAVDAGRQAHIREALKLRFAAGKRDQQHWSSEFAWLFDLRDAAVHAGYEYREPVPHPSGVLNASPVNADYSVESAARANDLLLDVLDVCTTQFKQANADARAWGLARRAGIKERISQMNTYRAVQPIEHWN